MSIYILANEKIILRCANWVLDRLHEYLLLSIEKYDYEKDEIINVFLERIDQNIYGPGGVYVNIADYFKDRPTELTIFIELVTAAIEKADKEQQLDAQARQILLNFRDKLIEYLKTIKKD